MSDAAVIVAVASPPGRAARGLVRASGRGLAEAGTRWLGADLPDRRFVRVSAALERGVRLPSLACAFRAPRSYTGEDVLELLLPGNAGLLERVAHALIRAMEALGCAARSAGPGEFTARAWLNGRMDLAQAEGVAATIAARGDAELRAARSLLSGRLGRLTDAWSERLAVLLARVEAGIDFADQDDVVTISTAELAGGVRSVREELIQHLEGSVGLERLSQLPRVVLAGPPNAGKSSLFNALLGRTRTLTSSLAGTTRDAIVEPLSLPEAGGWREVLLVDVPGVDVPGADVPGGEVPGGRELASNGSDAEPKPLQREPLFDHESAREVVGSRMRDAAVAAQQHADVVLRCRPAASLDFPATTFPPPCERVIDVITKCDLAPGRGEPDREGVAAVRSGAINRGAAHTSTAHTSTIHTSTIHTSAIHTSAVRGTGLEDLRRAIVDLVAGAGAPVEADAFVVSSRSRGAFEAAIAALREVESGLAGAMDEEAPPHVELVAAGLRSALDRLGDVSGRVDSDAVLDLVFARFCIGK